MASNLVISGGPSHDFDATSAAAADLLSEVGLDSTVIDDPGVAIGDLAERPGAWDVVTVNALRWRMEADRYTALRAEWAFSLSETQAQALADHVAAGGGLLALHTAVICFDGDPRWSATVGAAWNWDRSSHPPPGHVAVQLTAAGRDHEITRGLQDFPIHDEAYGFLDLEPDVDALATTSHGGATHPLLWARTVGRGRVVTDLLGHDLTSFESEPHREILRRAARWVTPPTKEAP